MGLRLRAEPFGGLAQLVEQETLNLLVRGSSPRPFTTFVQNPAVRAGFFVVLDAP